MKIKKITGLLLAFSLVFILGNCTETEDGILILIDGYIDGYTVREWNNRYNSSSVISLINNNRNTWGHWKRMDNERITWQISSTFIKIQGGLVSENIVLEMQSQNLIKVTESITESVAGPAGSRTYYLNRQRK